MNNVVFFMQGDSRLTKMVLFDCDGVLVNTEEIGYQIMKDMLAQQNIHYTREAYVELLSGITYEQFHQKLRELHPHLPEGFRAELHDRLKEAAETQMKVIEGARELLQKLKDHNIPFAVCSNSGMENLIAKLKRADLFDFFVPYIYSRHHVDHPKPAPDMYLLAAENRGIDPKDCLVVEDSMTGAMAGVAAGMTVIGFVGEAHRHDKEAELLEKMGAKMIALNMEQVWDHIARFAGIKSQPAYQAGPSL